MRPGSGGTAGAGPFAGRCRPGRLPVAAAGGADGGQHRQFGSAAVAAIMAGVRRYRTARRAAWWLFAGWPPRSPAT